MSSAGSFNCRSSRIADILDKADAIRQKRQQAIQATDEFFRSIFLHMFGDPAKNHKRWERKPIKKFGIVTTGNTPPREREDYYGNDIEWIKSDNINTPYHFLTKAKEGLSKKGKNIGRIVPCDSILVTCIAGSPQCIGNAALANREIAFNQQINAISPFKDADPYFLYVLLLIGKKLIQKASTKSMKGLVSKTNFEEIELPCPPEELQRRFGKIFFKIIELNKKANISFQESNNLFNSLVQRAFSGEL